MPSSWGQPIMRSGATTDLTPCSFKKAITFAPTSGVDAYVNVLGEPTLHRVRLRMFLADDGDNDFGGKIGGRAVAGDRGDGKTAKSPSRFFLQPFLRCCPPSLHARRLTILSWRRFATSSWSFC
jgi:hypothetical protein